MTDEQNQRPEGTEAEPKAEDMQTEPAADVSTLTPPVGDAAKPDVSDDDDDEGLDEEPAEATRVSPYSAAGFAVSLLSLFQAPQNIFLSAQQPVQVMQFLKFLLPTLAVPVGGALVALFLAARGEEEIFVNDGRLGGVGYFKAARIISIGVLVLSLIAVIVVLFLSEQPQVPQFGG
jgi:hypothetical protein